MSSNNLRSKVFVGGLKDCGTEKQLKQIFEKFGQVRTVWMAHNPPGFAFIDYYDERDAKDACDELDGSKLFGLKVSVEMAKGHGHSKTGRGGGGGSSMGGGGSYRSSNGGGSSGRGNYGDMGPPSRGRRYDDDDDGYFRDRSPPQRSSRRSPDYTYGGTNYRKSAPNESNIASQYLANLSFASLRLLEDSLFWLLARRFHPDKLNLICNIVASFLYNEVSQRSQLQSLMSQITRKIRSTYPFRPVA